MTKRKAKKRAEPGKLEMELFTAYPCYLDPHKRFYPHAHSHHELVLVNVGRLRVRVHGKEHVAVPGDVMLYTAGAVHEEWVEGDGPVLTWACNFTGEGFGRNEPVFCRDIYGRILLLLVKLNYLWSQNEIVGGLHRQYPPVLQAFREELSRLPIWDSNPMVDEVRAFVRSRIQEPFTLDGLAEVAGISKSHFVRQYKTLTGHTPMEDIRFVRVEEAARLVSTTDIPLHEIAPLVGLANVYHLSRRLRELLDVGVRELRHPGG